MECYGSSGRLTGMKIIGNIEAYFASIYRRSLRKSTHFCDERYAIRRGLGADSKQVVSNCSLIDAVQEPGRAHHVWTPLSPLCRKTERGHRDLLGHFMHAGYDQ
jgi:hypothetical protein